MDFNIRSNPFDCKLLCREKFLKLLLTKLKNRQKSNSKNKKQNEPKVKSRDKAKHSSQQLKDFKRKEKGQEVKFKKIGLK